MKQSTLLLIIGLLLFGAVSATTNCPLAAAQQSRILSDAVGLTAQNNNNNDTAQKLVYSYAFEDSFGSVPDVAIGLNQITSAQSPYLQILITKARTTEKGIYFQAQSGSQSKWKEFKINFIATDRQDIELGSATVYNPSSTPVNALELKYPITKNFQDQTIKVKSFLQGVSVQSANKQTIGVNQNTTLVSSHTLYFQFSSVSRTSIIHQLSISIIIFSIETPGILYADGIIDQNFVISKTQITIPKHGINELRTYIVGINAFETSAAQPISISSAIDETFRLVIGPIDRNQIDYISVSYLILSVVDCGSCTGYPLLFDGICKITCPEGTREKNGVCVPIDCVDGFVKVDGQCIPQCRQYQYYDKISGRCVCVNQYYLINGRCQPCKKDQFFSYREGICKPYCTYNSYFNPTDKKCYCLQGFNLIDGSCQQCRYGTYYNPATQQCLDICAEYEVYSPTGCICRNGYYRINGFCQRCPYGLIFNPEIQGCVCPKGFQLLQGNICKPECRQREIRVGTQCQCQVGFQLINGRCDVCPPNSFYDYPTESCKCEYRYTWVKGKCMIVCPDYQYFNETSTLCIDRCTKYGQVWINGKCECGQDFERTINGACIPKCGPIQYRDANGECKCYEGYAKNPYGQCRPVNCPEGTYWNQTEYDCISKCGAFEIFINGYCVCQAGYQKDNAYGVCIPDCNGNQVRVNGFCKCAPGYTLIPGGFCILDCAPGSTNINGMCVCKENCGGGAPYCPYGQQFDPFLRQCRCKSPKVWVLGQCVENKECGLNQYWCGSYCACINGFFRVNGTCVYVPPAPTCPPNSVSNGVNCQCLPGFYPVTPGTCRKCPPGQIWTGKKCAKDFCDPGYVLNPITGECQPRLPLCNTNEEWTGVNCRCKLGYFWIDHKCQSCPYGTFFDGIKCSTGAGYRCQDPYAFHNGVRCVCIPGYYPLADGRCVSCPKYTTWDGSCCKPDAGHYVPLTTP